MNTPLIFTNNLKYDVEELLMSNAKDIKSQFDHEGYLIVKNCILPDEIDQIREDAQYIFSLQLATHGFKYNYSDQEEFEQELYSFFKQYPETFFNCGKHIQHLISLHRLSLDNRIINKLKELGLRFPNICTRPVLYFNTKHLATKDIYHTMPPHQDFYSMEGSSNSIVIWLPLTNVTKKIGTLQIVPRSHKNGLITTANQDGFGIVSKYKNNDFISVELEKGDVLFFSSFLVHRSGINSTDSIRWSVHYRFNDLEDSDFIKRQYPHPYVYYPKSKIESET